MKLVERRVGLVMDETHKSTIGSIGDLNKQTKLTITHPSIPSDVETQGSRVFFHPKDEESSCLVYTL
jgi:hypothetical protein